MRWLCVASGVTLLALLLVTPASAHPGRTAADGCHYCRTNCDRWGVSWNVRHCHGGPPLPLPTSTPTPKPRPTVTLTPPPTFMPTPTLTIEQTPTLEPEVVGEISDPQGSTGDTILGLALLGGMGWGTIWLGRKVWRKVRGQTTEDENT